MKFTQESALKKVPAVWNLADAKNRFSEVVNLAIHWGPQVVSRRGDKVVIMSEKNYQKLCGTKASFIEFLFNGPGLEGVDLSRKKSAMRKVSL